MKNKKMIYILFCLMMTCTLLNGINLAQAGSYSISANKTNVVAGDSVTVSIYVNGGVVRPSVSASGSCKYSSGGFSEQIDSMGSTTQSITYKTTGEGTCTIHVSGTYTDYDTEEQSSINKNISVTVKKKDTGGSNNNGGSNNSGSNNGDNNQTTKPKANLDLDVFKIDQGTLSPKYSNSVNKYSVTLPAKTTSVKLSITPADSAIQVNGNGTHKLKPGNNKIEVTLYDAFAKETRKITLNIYVEEEPEVYLDYNDEKLGIYPSFKDAKIPEGFEKIKLTIDGKEVNAIQNSKGLTLLYMENNLKEKVFYLYNVSENKVISQYQPLTIDGKIYFASMLPKEYLDLKGFTVGNIEVGEIEIEGLKYDIKDFSNFALIYLMDESGNTSLYQYESTQGSLQLYNGAASITQEEYEEVINEKEKMMTYIYVAGGMAGLMAILSIAGFGLAHKYKKRVFATRKKYNEMVNSLNKDID